MNIDRRLKVFLLWPLLVITILLALLRIALSPASEYALREWFAQQGIDATVDAISFDFRDSRLRMRNLRAGGEASPLLAVDALDVDWTWRALFERRLQVDAIRLEGLFVDIERDPEERLVIAGIDPGSGAEPEAAASIPPEPIEWQVAFGDLVIEGFKACYRDPRDRSACGGFHRLDWNGTVELDLARLDETVPPLQVAGDVSLDGVELQDNRRERELLTLDRLALARLRLDGLNRIGYDELSLSGIFIDIERGPDARLSIAGIDLGGGAPPDSPAPEPAAEAPSGNIEIGPTVIDDFRHCYRAPPDLDYCGGFGRFDWDGSAELDLAGLGEAVLPLQAAGDFRLDRVDLRHTRLERSLIAFERFALNSLQIDGLDRIEIDNAALDSLELLERADRPDRPWVTSFEQLRARQLRLRDMARVEIAGIELQGHALTLVKGERGRFEHEQWLPVLPDEDTAAAAETAADQPSTAKTGDAAAGGTAFSFAVDSLDYSTDRGIVFRDRSLEKEFVVTLNPISLELQNLDSAQPEQVSRIEYSANYAEHGKIALDGSATPFAERPSFDITGRIEGLDLRDLSPFTATAVGHRIKSGQLDADLDLVAERGVLDSKVDLTLIQFEFDAISDAERERINERFGFPLNASLSLLKDRDNRIRLDIPITGDLENPDFDPSDAITKALSSAITTAVLNYYTPFGLVTLADGLLSLATALRFEPVVFPAGSGDISAVDTGELDRIATLMRERPGVDVTLCPFTNRADRIALFPETAGIPADELELDAARRAGLEQLGEARAAALKRYLADRGIEPGRLVLCAAEHDENDRPAAGARTGDAESTAPDAAADGLAGVEITI